MSWFEWAVIGLLAGIGYLLAKCGDLLQSVLVEVRFSNRDLRERLRNELYDD